MSTDKTQTFTNSNFMKITQKINILFLYGASFLFLYNFGHAGTLAAANPLPLTPILSLQKFLLL